LAVLGFDLRSSMLARQALYHWSHAPSPFSILHGWAPEWRETLWSVGVRKHSAFVWKTLVTVCFLIRVDDWQKSPSSWGPVGCKSSRQLLMGAGGGKRIGLK
jgi:hypothetical protein